MQFKTRPRTDHIVVHCSATPADMSIGRTEIDLWHRQRSWLMIGYHIVIRRDGTIEWGRPLEQMGAHVKGHNDASVGVCLVGGADAEGEPEDNFTDEQWEALYFVLTALSVYYPEAKVVGHYELDSRKACPSFNVQELHL